MTEEKDPRTDVSRVQFVNSPTAETQVPFPHFSRAPANKTLVDVLGVRMAPRFGFTQVFRN